MAREQTRWRMGNAAGRRGAAAVVWVVVIVAVALVVTIAAAVKHRQNAQAAAAASAAAQEPAQPVPAAVMAALDSIPAATWLHVGTQGATVPVFAGDSDWAGGKPVVLYIGAGYCPYCAAARWSIVTALARFGTFAGLSLDYSSPVDVFANTATFSFYKSSYTSDYIDFQSVELEGNAQRPDGSYIPLEKPTDRQQALITKYDAPPYVSAAAAGGIPFILVGGRYTWSGSPFNPSVLSGKSHAAIAGTLAQASGDAATAILSNANEMSAAICAVDGGKPAAVCSAPDIQSAIKALPAKSP